MIRWLKLMTSIFTRLQPSLLFLFFLAAAVSSCSQHIPERYERPVLSVQRPRPRVDSSPIALAERPQWKNSTNSLLIVIDAGHGGGDDGASSPLFPAYKEKALTLTTATLLRGYLSQMGYRVVMTRQTDVFVPLIERSQFANDRRSKLFVSIHFNSAPKKEASGLEVYYYQSDKDLKRSEESKDLAQSILDRTLAATQAKSRGVKEGNFAVIRETKMAAVLIEGGFLTNESEMAKIKDPSYLKRLAWGIARGIEEYLKS